jgi:hypothetical protein
VAIVTFFLLRTDPVPRIITMQTFLVASEVAAEKASVPVAFKSLLACLTGYTVVIAYAFEMPANAHRRS